MDTMSGPHQMRGKSWRPQIHDVAVLFHPLFSLHGRSSWSAISLGSMLSLWRGRALHTNKLFQAFGVVTVVVIILISLNRFTDRSSFDFALPPNPSFASDVKAGNASLYQTAPSYVNAIMSPDDKAFPRLDCPAPSPGRYEYLRSNAPRAPQSRSKVQYFFALDLHQCASLLPRLLGSIVEAMHFLGPEKCVLSIVEGRSDDGTYEILMVLRKEIEDLGAKYFLESSNLNPGTGDRIEALAELRNKALEPMLRNPSDYSSDTTVVFLNDISACMEDILELVHQRVYQNADMTCAMDWTYVGRDPTFYDVWIARGMTGDSFFEIPEDGNWNSAWNLFWNDPKARERLNSHKPFQVFSCWNGAAVFTAKPILERVLQFRHSKADECYQGEPKLFCKDMWKAGYGKIAVVPSVNIEYSDEAAKKIKALKGYTSQWVEKDGDTDPTIRIEWETKPPEKVKCMTNYAAQEWVAWDEGLK